MAVEITFNQPTGAGAGAAGKARNDIWLDQEVELVSSGDGSSWLWSLLDRPPGSAAEITDETSETALFTPDVIGTYRIKLTVDGTDFVIKVVRARYDSSGVLANRGWALPSIDEERDEADYDSNDRHWGEVWETILEDIRVNAFITGSFTADGDLSGDETSQTVVGIQGSEVEATPPADGQALIWSDLSSKWEPSALPSGFTAGGDLGDWTPPGDDVQRVVGIDAISAPLSETAADGLFVKIVSTVAPKYPRAMLKDGDDILWISQHNPDNGDPEPELPIVWLMDLSDNSLVATIDLGDTVNRGIRDIAQDDDYVYFSGWKAAVVAIVSKTTRAVVGWGSLTDGDQLNGICADNAGNFYGVGKANEGTWGVFRWSTAACIGALPDPDISAVYESASNFTGDGSWGDNARKLEYFASYLWLTGNSYTTELSKLDPSTLARVAFSTDTHASMSSAYNGTYVFVTNTQASTLDMFDTSCVKQASWTLSTLDGVQPDEIDISDAGDTIVFPGGGYDPDYCAVFSNGMVDQQFALLPTTNGRWGSVVAHGTKAICACFADSYGDGPNTGLYEVSLGPVPAPEVSEMDIAVNLVCAPVETIAGLPVADTALAQGSRIFWDAASSKWDYQGALTGYTQDTALYSRTAVGEFTGGPTGSGVDNSFFGYRAGSYNSTGEENSYFGSQAGRLAHSSGFGNTAVGAYSLRSTFTTLIPYRNSCLGVRTGYALTSGHSNVLLGFEAGDAITTGTSNILVGASTETSAIGSNNEIVIGYFAQGKGSGHIVLGTTDTTSEAWIYADTMHLGKEGGVDKYWYFQNSASGVQPGFKWDNTGGKVQFSNDGSAWTDLGGGGGSSLVGVTNDGTPYPNWLTALGENAGTSLSTSYSAGTLGITCIGADAGTTLNTTGLFGVFVGYQAGRYYTGNQSTFVGSVSGYYGTGDYNTGVGRYALYSTTGSTHTYCTAIGFNSGKYHNSTSYCTYVGALAGEYSGTGQRLVYVGYNAGNSASGNDNTIVGANAGRVFTTGIDNTIVGAQAGEDLATTASYNVLIGSSALAGAVTRNDNVAVGYKAGFSYDVAKCVFVGNLAGGGNTKAARAAGTYSTYVGCEAGYYGSNGNYNVGVGYRSLYGISSAINGSGNTAVGVEAGYGMTNGDYNTFVGMYAGRHVTTGDYNVFIGHQAGYVNPITGTDNICIGRYSDLVAGTDGYAIAIGYSCVGATSTVAIGRSITLANSNSGMISPLAPASSAVPSGEFWIGDATRNYAVRAGSFPVHSDVRVKKNIEEIPFGLDFILGLRPRLYDLKFPSTNASKRKHMGFVAQELREDTKKKGLDGSLIADDDPDNWAVNYNQLVAPLVKAVQELSGQVADLKKELAELKASR